MEDEEREFSLVGCEQFFMINVDCQEPGPVFCVLLMKNTNKHLLMISSYLSLKIPKWYRITICPTSKMFARSWGGWRKLRGCIWELGWRGWLTLMLSMLTLMSLMLMLKCWVCWCRDCSVLVLVTRTGATARPAPLSSLRPHSVTSRPPGDTHTHTHTRTHTDWHSLTQTLNFHVEHLPARPPAASLEPTAISCYTIGRHSSDNVQSLRCSASEANNRMPEKFPFIIVRAVLTSSTAWELQTWTPSVSLVLQY